MPKRITPSQLKSALQKAQRDQKRAVDNYNRDVRKYNAAVKQAVGVVNREIRNYNTSVRVHNREVESQRRRLRQEVARLNSRPSTSYVTYRTSTTAFVRAYDSVDGRLASAPGSAADGRFMDLLGDEAANSVYVANALDGDGEPQDDPTTDELRAPSMLEELRPFGDDLVDRWKGALFSLSPENPDAARHFCTSAREIIISMLDGSAPDDHVKKFDPACQLAPSGAVSRRAKVAYLLQRHGVTDRGVTDLVEQDVENLLSLFSTFNKGTHGQAGRFSITELSAVRTRVESAIEFMHQVVKAA